MSMLIEESSSAFRASVQGKRGFGCRRRLGRAVSFYPFLNSPLRGSDTRKGFQETARPKRLGIVP